MKGRRTIAVEITQPAADVLRELAKAIQDEKYQFDDDATFKLAMGLHVQLGADFHKRLAQKVNELADIIEKGVL